MLQTSEKLKYDKVSQCGIKKTEEHKDDIRFWLETMQATIQWSNIFQAIKGIKKKLSTCNSLPSENKFLKHRWNKDFFSDIGKLKEFNTSRSVSQEILKAVP